VQEKTLNLGDFYTHEDLQLSIPYLYYQIGPQRYKWLKGKIENDPTYRATKEELTFSHKDLIISNPNITLNQLPPISLINHIQQTPYIWLPTMSTSFLFTQMPHGIYPLSAFFSHKTPAFHKLFSNRVKAEYQRDFENLQFRAATFPDFYGKPQPLWNRYECVPFDNTTQLQLATAQYQRSLYLDYLEKYYAIGSYGPEHHCEVGEDGEVECATGGDIDGHDGEKLALLKKLTQRHHLSNGHNNGQNGQNSKSSALGSITEHEDADVGIGSLNFDDIDGDDHQQQQHNSPSNNSSDDNLGLASPSPATIDPNVKTPSHNPNSNDNTTTPTNNLTSDDTISTPYDNIFNDPCLDNLSYDPSTNHLILPQIHPSDNRFYPIQTRPEHIHHYERSFLPQILKQQQTTYPSHGTRMSSPTDIDVLGASVLSFTPGLREVFLMNGGADVSRNSLLLRITTNRSCLLIPGGQKEMFYSSHKDFNYHFHTGHLGFIKIALRTGAPIVPIISFGENQLLSTLQWPEAQQLLYRYTRVVLPIYPHGPALSPLPHSSPITLAVGEPIFVPCFDTDDIPDDVVSYYHNLYLAHIARLFFESRESIPFARNSTLTFVS
jgi:hypothetical protein